MTRRESRICAFELLYETDFHVEKTPAELYEQSLQARDEKGSEFAKNLYFICAEHIADIDSAIQENTENWKISRMTAVTKALLRLAVGEMLYTDVPPKAVINEAVEIAKLYDEDRAPRFINGILNKIARATGKIGE